MNTDERRRVEVLHKKILRVILGVNVRERIKIRDIRGRCGYRRSLPKRMDQSILKWFLHMGKMYKAEGEIDRREERLNESKIGFSFQESEKRDRNRSGWKAIVYRDR